MKILRESIPLAEFEQKSQKIRDAIECHPAFQKAKIVFFTAPCKGEPNLLPLVEKHLSQKKICFPGIKDYKNGRMEAKSIQNLKELSSGIFGIYEPPESAERCPPESIDLFLIPALAVDIEGYRLGSGGGFFDRFLEKAKGYCIATVFAAQVFEKIPKEAHDKKMNEILTEERSIVI